MLRQAISEFTSNQVLIERSRHAQKYSCMLGNAKPPLAGLLCKVLSLILGRLLFQINLVIMELISLKKFYKEREESWKIKIKA